MSDIGARWFYSAGDDRKGPFSELQIGALLLAGAIDEHTKVWSEDIADWTPLFRTDLRKLLGDKQIAPPNVPPAEQDAAPVRQSENKNANKTYARSENTGINSNSISFGNAISICMNKYVTFSGRASRPEFWYFYLFIILGSIATLTVDIAILNAGDIFPLNLIFTLAILLPQFAVGVRRLHDTDRSAWWLLIGLIPLVGFILIVFLCQKGTTGPNRFG